MGGYAAILSGMLVNVDGVLAFNPQTCLKPLWRLLHYDRRSWRKKNKIYESLTKTPYYYYCLKRVLRKMEPKPNIAVHVGSDRLDLAHARHIKQFDNVSIIKYENKKHNLPASLKQKGTLSKKIRKFCNL